jgi:hypothetical protein
MEMKIKIIEPLFCPSTLGGEIRIGAGDYVVTHQNDNGKFISIVTDTGYATVRPQHSD